MDTRDKNDAGCRLILINVLASKLENHPSYLTSIFVEHISNVHVKVPIHIKPYTHTSIFLSRPRLFLLPVPSQRLFTNSSQ